MPRRSSPPPEDRGLVTDLGPIQVDVPRTVGYFGALGLAVAVEIVPIPLAVFIAAVPIVRLLNRPGAPKAARLASQVYEGAAMPVGGQSEGTVRWAKDNRPDEPRPGGDGGRQMVRRPRRRSAPAGV